MKSLSIIFAIAAIFTTSLFSQELASNNNDQTPFPAEAIGLLEIFYENGQYFAITGKRNVNIRLFSNDEDETFVENFQLVHGDLTPIWYGPGYKISIDVNGNNKVFKQQVHSEFKSGILADYKEQKESAKEKNITTK